MGHSVISVDSLDRQQDSIHCGGGAGGCVDIFIPRVCGFAELVGSSVCNGRWCAFPCLETAVERAMRLYSRKSASSRIFSLPLTLLLERSEVLFQIHYATNDVLFWQNVRRVPRFLRWNSNGGCHAHMRACFCTEGRRRGGKGVFFDMCWAYLLGLHSLVIAGIFKTWTSTVCMYFCVFPQI